LAQARIATLEWPDFLAAAGSAGNDGVRFLFSNYGLDTNLRELTRGGEAVPVEPKVFDLLANLIESRERVVSKDDHRTDLGRPCGLRIHPGQPDQCRAKGGRRQRQGSGHDPHRRAQGLSLCR
jgi:hypothetical protein